MSRDLPPGLAIKGNRILIRIKRPGKGWCWESSGLEPHQVQQAAKLRAHMQAMIDSGQPLEEYGRTSVRAYAKRWLAARKDNGLKSHDDYEARLRLHVLDFAFDTHRLFGSLFMDEIRPLHCRAVITAARKKGLAPKSVINLHSICSAMFKDSVADEILTHSPWVISKRDLPKKRDKDPEWRATAKFTKNEMRLLLWAPDEKVPWDRRMLYALMYFGAMRFGEASARRWRDRLDPEGGRALHIHNQFSSERGEEDETKTLSSRLMPEHPELTTLLNAWQLAGWQQFFGRPPKPDDLIVPSRRGMNRRKNHSLHKLHEDLERLGLRKRRQHDLRRSFISHAVDDGATRERLKPGTHGLGSSVLEMYDSPDWLACVEHVLRLKLGAPQAMATMATGSPKTLGNSGHQKGDAGAKPAKFREMPMNEYLPDSDFNSRRLHHLNASEDTLRSIPEQSSHGVAMAARALLEATGGDLTAAIAALRAAQASAA